MKSKKRKEKTEKGIEKCEGRRDEVIIRKYDYWRGFLRRDRTLLLPSHNERKSETPV
jgi:hypothetical protein